MALCAFRNAKPDSSIAFPAATPTRERALEGWVGWSTLLLTLTLFVACGPVQKNTTAFASPARSEISPREPKVSQPSGQLVWADPSSNERNQVVWFRRDVRLEAPVDEAVLHLFADSRYLLFVNGAVISSGPARFYPGRPEYDTIELAPYLTPGNNVIGVQVLSFGTSSFQQRRLPGAFVAWGDVRSNDNVQDLSTPGVWKYKRDDGYDSGAPRLSFAMSPIEVHDATKSGPDFLAADSNTAAAFIPRPLEDQRAWGQFVPRSIPALGSDVLSPKALTAMFTLSNDEELFSFRLPVADSSRAEYDKSSLLFARTKIFSPRAQSVDLGLWWGDYYLNGRGPLKDAGLTPGQRSRNVVSVPLQKGYNDLFVRYRSVFGSWDFYVALPRASGLALSAHGIRDDAVVFETAGPFSPEQERVLAERSLPLPTSVDPLGDRASGDAPILWRPHRRDEEARNPALEINWRRVGDTLTHDPSRVFDIPIPAGRDTALVFDFGGTQLGRLLLEYTAPAGTAFDLAWAEQLEAERPAVLQQHGVFTGARTVSAGAANTVFQTVKPYGLRYLQLNVSRHSGPVTLRRVALVRETYPFTVSGNFESSDPALNALWHMGLRTLRVCAEDSYIDTPFRERALYAGDLLVEAAVTLATSGDTRLVKRSLRLLQGMYADLFSGSERHPDEIELLEDYPLLSIEVYRWLIDWSSDLDFARELFGSYRHLLDGVLAKRDSDGLVENKMVFIEWVLPASERAGKNAAYHALLARSLSSMAHIARRLGEGGVATHYEAASRDIAQRFHATFWDDAKGAFVDGVNANGRALSHLPLTSAWPSMWGLTSQAQESRLASFWDTEFGPEAPISSRTSPYGGFFVLGALYRQGHVRLAEDYMRRYWASMLADPEGTLWETFEHLGSSSHAWSAAPTYYLSTQVLGVNLGYTDGFTDPLVIAPQSETLSWARGSVPHPRGTIHVDWRIDGERLRMSVTAPKGVAYRVAPRGRLARLRLELNE